MKLQPARSDISPAGASKVVALCAAADDGITINSLKIADALKCSTAVQLEIEDCATAYCAAPNTEADTITEAVRFVLSQFGHFNISEIREAFRLVASGMVAGNLNAYHGQFSVRILGEVLNAYADYRTQIAREVRARKRAAELAALEDSRADMLKERFGTLSENLADLQDVNTKYARWQELPYWFCRRLIEEDTLKLTIEEKGKTWILAKHWAVNQVGSWVLDSTHQPEDRKRYLAASESIKENPDIFPDELKKEAEEAYSKMIVFENIAPFTGVKK